MEKSASAQQSKLNMAVNESSSLFKKNPSGFLKKNENKSGSSDLAKRFDRLAKDGSDSVDQSQVSEAVNPLGATGGLVLTTCLKLAMAGENRLSTGCDMMTEFLRGGLLPGKLYELYGESGSGKTQVAIQLLLQSLLSPQDGGLGGKSLYLMTGKPLNEKRFVEMKEAFLGTNRGKITEQDIHRQVIFSHCQTLEDYNKVFMNLAQRIESDRLRLLIIDNI